MSDREICLHEEWTEDPFDEDGGATVWCVCNACSYRIVRLRSPQREDIT
jgi:hypothetical protein